MNVRVKLSLSKTTNANILVDGGNYVVCMTDNDLFVAVYIVAQVLKVKAAIDALDLVMKAAKYETKTADTLTARKTLNKELTELAHMVEAVANDPDLPDDKRVGVVESAGMTCMKQTARGKQVFDVTRGEISGSAHVTMPTGALGYLITHTTDVKDFKDRCDPIESAYSIVDITGLTKNVEHAFFYKGIFRKTKQDWQGPITLMIV